MSRRDAPLVAALDQPDQPAHGGGSELAQGAADVGQLDLDDLRGELPIESDTVGSHQNRGTIDDTNPVPEPGALIEGGRPLVSEDRTGYVQLKSQCLDMFHEQHLVDRDLTQLGKQSRAQGSTSLDLPLPLRLLDIMS